VTQALARIIIGEQMLCISKRYRVVLTVHDSIVCCVPDDEAEACRAYVEECMRWTPAWAAGLPVDCESGIGKSYGDWWMTTEKKLPAWSFSGLKSFLGCAKKYYHLKVAKD